MIFEPNRNALEQVNNIRDVIVKWKSRCNKVCFDISTIRNTKKIYDVYRIHRDEKIIAFCKGNLPLIPLSMDGVVFTDAAVYFFGKDGAEKIQHIEYSMLPRYLVAHDGEKGRVYVISDQFEREIYRGTVFSQNVAGIEIVRILISIQQELCATNPKAKAERDIVIQGMLQQATEELQTGILSKRTNAVLGGLMLQPECCNRATSLKAEYIFRECDQEKYSEFVKSLYGCVSDYTYNELERIPQCPKAEFSCVRSHHRPSQGSARRRRWTWPGKELSRWCCCRQCQCPAQRPGPKPLKSRRPDQLKARPVRMG